MSVGTSSFRVVGIRYSAAGLLELMWKPELTWNRSVTPVARPRITSEIPGDDRVTEGAFRCGSSCAASGVAKSATTKTCESGFTIIDLFPWNGPDRVKQALITWRLQRSAREFS